MGFLSGSVDFTSYRRMMVFIDGENITMRYQDSIKKGLKPKGNVIHEKDTFVWEPNFTLNVGKHEIIRAIYYTYAVGDQGKIEEINRNIKSTEFFKNPYSHLPNFLYPCIFKKENRNRSGKGVDIQMTVDILNHVYNNNLDTVYLMSGDGDYLPVINEVIRCGKQIYLAAFSSGLSPKLSNRVDSFHDLDKICFMPKGDEAP